MSDQARRERREALTEIMNESERLGLYSDKPTSESGRQPLCNAEFALRKGCCHTDGRGHAGNHYVLVGGEIIHFAEWEASRPVSDESWLENLEIGEDQSDDPHGPFTLEECALGEALFRHTQRDRDSVTGVAGPKFNDDWSKVRVRQMFGWYAAARELLRDAQEAFVAARREGK